MTEQEAAFIMARSRARCWWHSLTDPPVAVGWEDIEQEVRIGVWEATTDHRPDKSGFKTFATRKALWRAKQLVRLMRMFGRTYDTIQWYRRRKGLPPLVGRPPWFQAPFSTDHPDVLEEGCEESGLQQVSIRAAIDRLPYLERLVIRLLYIHGLTPDETAEATGLARRSVFKVSRRAKEKLREYLA